MRLSRLVISVGVWICLAPTPSSNMLAEHRRRPWYSLEIPRLRLEGERGRDTCSAFLYRKRNGLSDGPKCFTLVADSQLRGTVEEPKDPLLGGPIVVLFTLGREVFRTISGAISGTSSKGASAVPEQKREKKDRPKKAKKDGTGKQLDQGTLNKMLWKACEEGRTTDAMKLISQVATIPFILV